MKTPIISLLTLFLISLASSNSATFNIAENNVQVQINLDDPTEILLPATYENLESTGNFEIIKNILFSSEPSTITFSTDAYLRKTNKELLFTQQKFTDGQINIKVILPEGYILSDGLVFPKEYTISSNGRNVILEWSNFEQTEIIIFYENPNETGNMVYLLILFLVILATIIFYFQQKHHKKKVKKIESKQKEKITAIKKNRKELITHNLFGDEKRIVEYLLTKKGKSCWTKEMVRDLEMPKVRLSRKVRSLSEKGFVKKEPHGNENRVSLINK